MYKDEIVLKGDAIDSFERVELITEVILIGKYGGIRRILLTDENNGLYKILN